MIAGDNFQLVNREDDIRIVHEEGSHGCAGKHHFVPVRQLVEFLPGFRTAQDDLVSRR